MNEQIKKILEQEETKMNEEDLLFGTHGYITSPSGLRDIRLATLRSLPLTRLVDEFELAEHRDVDILKVVFDAYTAVSKKYFARIK